MNKIFLFTCTIVSCAVNSLFAIDKNNFNNSINKNLIKNDTSHSIDLENKKRGSFNYTSIGASLPIPVPGVCFGHREAISNTSAIDLSMGISTLIVATGIAGNAYYLKYLEDTDYYFGGGGNVWLGFIAYVPASFGTSPSISFGKEKEKSFQQISINPVHFSTVGVSFIPTVTYQYGFKF